MTRNIIKSFFRVIFKIALIAFVCFLAFLVYLNIGQVEPAKQITFGVTFSQMFAQQMGLDWQKAYLAVLDDLEVKKIRLIAYWPKIEPKQGEYFFDDLDWQIKEAEKRGVEVILAVGRKLPRWPECHIPTWAYGLTEPGQQHLILLYLTEVVKHYQDNQAIKIWQVENEPFLKGFGECPELDSNFLKREISLVRQTDKSEKGRLIMLTASGELSSWIQPASQADVFGTTLYRTVWVEEIGRHLKYPIRPIFYHKRANLDRFLTSCQRLLSP